MSSPYYIALRRDSDGRRFWVIVDAEENRELKNLPRFYHADDADAVFAELLVAIEKGKNTHA